MAGTLRKRSHKILASPSPDGAMSNAIEIPRGSRHCNPAADVSRGETSAAVLDCMNHGLATIANANGSMASLPTDAVVLLPDTFDTKALADALNEWLRTGTAAGPWRTRAGHIHKAHSPRICLMPTLLRWNVHISAPFREPRPWSSD